ncbi:SCO0930 family lipoprotein [Streptomyces sp. NBC_00249]|uniref:SCO0930 family lipoprotein n=1 Tax=Streptomyces sp. NBC_00249 TaxID=2975690 RepID=UPI002258A908|nr:SCO0930 family lipoprotein [Streptomyces sp. NBC_00249]MCX5193017.1 SCO0930 family lipoprotein [Streptomyces sp. NBC_00249]
MRRGIFAGSAVAVLLLTAGCGLSDNPSGKSDAVQPVGDSKQLGSLYGSGSGSGSGYGSGADAGYGGDTGAAAAGAGAAAGQLKVQELPNLGSTVTDGQGITLYRFDKDTAKPPKSNCEGDCAKAWPAVAADDASAGAGIDAGLLGSVARADGTKQLTLGGWPVYRYAKDTKPGDTLGEGVGGTWHVLGPDGKPAAPAKPGGAGADPAAPAVPAVPPKKGALSVNANAQLGNIVADGEGRTLYRFDKDSAWPMKIGCVDSCVDTWKPAKPVDKAEVSGIPAELVGSVKRPDGSEQLTIDCWPVYTFTGDKEPGDISGHNKQGLWFAVTDKGKKAKAA